MLSFHQDPRGIAPGGEVCHREIFHDMEPTGLPAWTRPACPRCTASGCSASTRRSATRAGTAPLVCLAAAAATRTPRGTLSSDGLDAAGARVEDVVAITSLHMDVRDIPRVRELLGERCPQAWSAAGATGFASLESRHAFRALARRRSAAE